LRQPFSPVDKVRISAEEQTAGNCWKGRLSTKYQQTQKHEVAGDIAYRLKIPVQAFAGLTGIRCFLRQFKRNSAAHSIRL
jgi:hypothetical protein